MRAVRAIERLDAIPVDFRADPDGAWEYETLARWAGFDESWGEMSVGALSAPYAGFPEGAAVVVLTTGSHRSVVLVDCTIAHEVRAHEVRAHEVRAHEVRACA